MPEELRYLFVWWKTELGSADPLTFERMDAWARVTQKDLRGWEADALLKLDMIYRYVRNNGVTT